MGLIGYYGHGVALSVHLGQWPALAPSPPTPPTRALKKMNALLSQRMLISAYCESLS
jgi:hypothetical protein